MGVKQHSLPTFFPKSVADDDDDDDDDNDEVKKMMTMMIHSVIYPSLSAFLLCVCVYVCLSPSLISLFVFLSNCTPQSAYLLIYLFSMYIFLRYADVYVAYA